MAAIFIGHFLFQLDIYNNRIVIRVAMHRFIFHLIGAVLVIPVGIHMPGTHAYDLGAHRRVGKAAIQVSGFSFAGIGVVCRVSERSHIRIACPHDGLNRSLLRIAVIVSQ